MVKGLPVIHQQDKVARKASDISSWLAILITREKVSSFFASVVKAFLHNTTVYMINIFFHVCLISLISCWHVNHLSHHSVRFERQSLHDSQFKVVCQDFLRWWRLDHWKIRITHRQWRSNSPRKWRKPIYEKKNPKLHIQWLWLWHFSRLTTKIDNWKICRRPTLAVFLKDFFCR